MHWLRAKEQILTCYFKNEAKELREVVDKIFRAKYGGTTDKDMDEFYSVANEVFVDVLKRYDPSKGDFGGLLYGALDKGIIDEIKRQNRSKRRTKIDIVEVDCTGNKVIKRVPVQDKSIDEPINEEDDTTLGECIAADEKYEVENIVSRKLDDFYDENVDIFLSGLPKIQRQILIMKMNKVPVNIIQERLGLSNTTYNKHCEQIKSFKNINTLFSKQQVSKYKEEEEMEVTETTQTMENCKTDKMSISSIIKKIDKHMLRFDHPLQRESDQWTNAMKGNLVSDILQGNKLHPLIFAEQIINGVPIIWDLDGKQRCTNAYMFVKNSFKISKNIRRWMIKYQTTKKDEDGNMVLDENGFPIAINAEFDIRGKKFSQLPEELQERFMDYNFNYDLYLNCDDDDIAYHIERYNDGKPMTASQKGITKLGTDYAEMVKSISNMPFFKDMGGYKVSEAKNGTINRVVVESVMAANHLEEWKKNQDDMCKYLKDNATMTEFEDFEDMVARLEKVVTTDTANMFDSKDSFLWFGLFARFIKSDKDDQQFVEFMTEFGRSLHNRTVDGMNYNDWNDKSTKDKNVVIGKMNYLETLLHDFINAKAA